MIEPLVLLDLIFEAQRFTALSNSLKRAYVFDRLGPLTRREGFHRSVNRCIFDAL